MRKRHGIAARAIDRCSRTFEPASFDVEDTSLISGMPPSHDHFPGVIRYAIPSEQWHCWLTSPRGTKKARRGRTTTAARADSI